MAPVQIVDEHHETSPVTDEGLHHLGEVRLEVVDVAVVLDAPGLPGVPGGRQVVAVDETRGQRAGGVAQQEPGRGAAQTFRLGHQVVPAFIGLRRDLRQDRLDQRVPDRFLGVVLPRIEGDRGNAAPVQHLAADVQEAGLAGSPRSEDTDGQGQVDGGLNGVAENATVCAEAELIVPSAGDRVVGQEQRRTSDIVHEALRRRAYA